MAQQDYRGDLQWLVVDDCEPETDCTMGQTVIRRRPAWEPGQITQCRNLRAAVPHVEGDVVVVIEDDDYYAPSYLSEQVERLFWAPMVGESESMYYHIGVPGYSVNPNTRHSSLFQTAFRKELLPLFAGICEVAPRFLDLALWSKAGGRIFPQSLISIGMKGLPGRQGIGIGHRKQRDWIQDPDFKTLAKWIGEDALVYESVACQSALTT